MRKLSVNCLKTSQEKVGEIFSLKGLILFLTCIFFFPELCEGLKLEEKNRLAASRWKALSKEGKKKFEDISKQYRQPDVFKLSNDEREKLIARQRRQLLAEVTYFV